MSCKNYLIILGCCLLSLAANGQVQLGMRLSNYSGVGGMQLNPAHNLASRQSWEFQLGAVYASAENNYGFVESTSILELWRARNFDASLVERPDLAPGEIPATENTFVVDYYPGLRQRYGLVNLGIEGPGLMIKLESGHTFGAFSGLRLAGGSQNVAEGFSYFPYFNQKFFEPFVVQPFDGALMLWGEVGLNYGFSVETYSGYMGFAFNFKFLGGLEGAYFKSERTLNFTKFPDNDFASDLGELRFGYTSSNLDPGNFSLQLNGGGFGLDLGFVYVIEGYDDVPEWRFGAAITDLGSVTFRENANPQVVLTDSIIYVDSEAYEFFNGLGDLPQVVKQFSEQALQDSLLSSAGTQFQLWTPTTLNLSADYAVSEMFFVNATLIQRLPFGDLQVPADNILALVPRMEHKWFEFSMPIIIYNYDRVRLGLAARLGVLTVGSDNIFSLVGQSDVSGMDFYVGLKVPGFSIASSDRVPRAGGKRKRSRVKCYNF
jgi:hypothetical protein